MKARLNRPVIILAGNCCGKSSLQQEGFVYNENGSAITSKLFVGPKAEDNYISVCFVDNYRNLQPSYSSAEWLAMIEQASLLETSVLTGVIREDNIKDLLKAMDDLVVCMVSVSYETMIKRYKDRLNSSKNEAAFPDAVLKTWMHTDNVHKKFEAISSLDLSTGRILHTQLEESEFLGDHYGHILLDNELIKEFS